MGFPWHPRGPGPRQSLHQLQKEKHINNNKNYHPHAANPQSNHTKHSERDVGSGDLGTNQNQHCLSWEGLRAFVICLQTSMIH